MRKTEKRLTPKQAAFVSEYAIDVNATQRREQGRLQREDGAQSKRREPVIECPRRGSGRRSEAKRLERTGITADRVLTNWPASRSSTSARCLTPTAR